MNIRREVLILDAIRGCPHLIVFCYPSSCAYQLAREVLRLRSFAREGTPSRGNQLSKLYKVAVGFEGKSGIERIVVSPV